MKKLFIVLILILAVVGVADSLFLVETQEMTCSLCGSRGLRTKSFFSDDTKVTFERKNLEKIFLIPHKHLWYGDGKHEITSILTYGKGDALGGPRLFPDFESLGNSIPMDYQGLEKEQIMGEFEKAMKKLCSTTNQVKANDQREFLAKLSLALKKLSDQQNPSASDFIQKLKEFSDQLCPSSSHLQFHPSTNSG